VDHFDALKAVKLCLGCECVEVLHDGEIDLCALTDFFVGLLGPHLVYLPDLLEFWHDNGDEEALQGLTVDVDLVDEWRSHVDIL